MKIDQLPKIDRYGHIRARQVALDGGQLNRMLKKHFSNSVSTASRPLGAFKTYATYARAIRQQSSGLYKVELVANPDLRYQTGLSGVLYRMCEVLDLYNGQRRHVTFSPPSGQCAYAFYQACAFLEQLEKRLVSAAGARVSDSHDRRDFRAVQAAAKALGYDESLDIAKAKAPTLKVP